MWEIWYEFPRGFNRGKQGQSQGPGQGPGQGQSPTSPGAAEPGARPGAPRGAGPQEGPRAPHRALGAREGQGRPRDVRGRVYIFVVVAGCYLGGLSGREPYWGAPTGLESG